MPATVFARPLGVCCLFTDGSRAELLLGEDLLPDLAGQLMRGLADLVKPHGDLNSATTVRSVLTSLRHFLRALARLGFDGPAQRLTRAQLAECFLGLAPRYEAHARAVLRRLDDLADVLATDVRRFVDGRAFHPRRRRERRSLPAYTEAEWQRVFRLRRWLRDLFRCEDSR